MGFRFRMNVLMSELQRSETEAPLYAVISSEARRFTLCASAEPPASIDLPVYPETSGTPMRIALTPLAVAGDTLMVCGVVAVVGLVVWLESGAPTH